MSLHDEYARLTPFEMAFPDRDRFGAFAAGVTDEASGRGADPTDLDAFVALPSVGSFLAELHGEGAPRVALLELGALAYHSMHFLRAGCPLFVLETAAVRRLIDEAPAGQPLPPSVAGYLQLPQHLFWTGAGGAGAPESVDGMFWTVTRKGRLHALPIVGLRPDRAGFGALSVPDAPLAHAEHWLRARVREHSGDYASTLPGSDLDALYAIEAAGEVLKLLARFFARVEAAGPQGPTLELAPPSPAGPRPSALPYRRVRSAA
jgi:hypothetical protein